MRMTIADHLAERHADVSKYSVTIDDKEGVATFLLFDLSGAVAGYQQYRPAADKAKKNHPREGRYFTYKSSGRHAVFGLESWNWSMPLYLVEGIFDCVRLHNLGLAAIATLSNDPRPLRSWLWSLGRPLYTICDAGEAGRKMAKFAHRHVTCAEKDLGAMTDAEVAETVSRFG
ncbi:toprim domain-containing protein [Rhizobium sp.]|uniref:toprim domain-containing protein n=1 Tax=Rhizobium sp. TaxID=391 RepID=UPI00289A96AD